MKTLLLIALTLAGTITHAQLLILGDDSSLITNTWTQNCTFETTSSNMPFAGNTHYELAYNYSTHWAGVGLNMDNFDGGNTVPEQDFSGYNHLRIAYRGLGGDVTLRINLRDDAIQGNVVTIGGVTNTYTVVDVPMLALTAGTSLSLETISEIVVAASGPTASASGVVYIDEIQLINKPTTSSTSQKTWARYARMNKGFNLANWLEAFWLIPFNTYPEVNRFDRIKISQMHDLGFNAMRLPVAFEQIADANPPYTIDTNSVVFDLIDSTILWASDYDMTLIITNHHGFQLTDANFMNEIPRLKIIWSQIIEKYGHLDPERYFFELYNEAHGISNNNFRQVADSLVQLLRANDVDHSLIVGASGYNSSYELLSFPPLNDSDIIYTFHSYDPYYFTHQQMSWTSPAYFPAKPFPDDPDDEQNLTNQVEGMKQWSLFYNLPVFLGEFGVSTAADPTSRCNYVSTMGEALAENNLPFYYWDATSLSDAFGFIENGDATDCFSEALRLENYNVCNLEVENLKDTGSGSLRNAIQCASDGDIISLSLDLQNDTIKLVIPSLFIDKNLTIQQSAPGTTYIAHSSTQASIEVLENKTLFLRNVNILQTSNNLEALNIKGSLIIDNVLIKKE